jgi:2-dehydro-3-deoxyphosphogluconate aldolase / (4S)-4-hydroxy-2-oxoglutarate aldolase
MTPEALRAGPVAEAIRRHRLVAVLRRVEPQSALLALVDDLHDAGVRVFEITLDAASGADDLAAVRSHLAAGAYGCVVGAGTVLRPDQLEAAVDAGANFAMSPVLDISLLRTALEAGVPFVPGAFTPTEIRAGWDAGATFVKLFPASVAGPSLVRELRGPMPEIELIPTGGIDASSASAFLGAGAVAVGIGSLLARMDPAARRALVRTVAGTPA